MKKITYLLLAVLTFAGMQSCKSEEKDLALNVMSYNIRLNVSSDSLNSWPYRKDVAAKMIKNHDVDIFGTQEVLPDQMVDLKERLPEYTALGVGREDGKNKGEYSALFYKTSKFNEVKSGTFWLSETPDVAGSMGWDAVCHRVATWAILEDIATKKKVFAINTHLDHVGKVARIEGVTLMLNRAHDLGEGLPVILTGDFNAEPDSEVIQHVLSETTPNNLVSSRDIAQEKNDQAWTFHDFGRLPENEREYIDYIFVSKDVEVKKYEVVEEKLDGIYVSDHNPLFAKIIIK